MSTEPIAAAGLVDAVAKAIDGWHADHPDLSVGEVVDALERVRAKLIDATNRSFNKPVQ